MQFDTDGQATLTRERPLWSLAAIGDLCAIGRVEEALCTGKPEAVMAPEVLEIIRSATLALPNLEAPICTSATPIPKTGPNFMSSPRILEAVRAAGFDLVGLANNHIMDQGVQGLEQTIRALDAQGIGHAGAALTHGDARRPVRRSVPGGEVSILSVAEGEFAQAQEDGPGAARLDPVTTCREIERERRECSLVVISVHAGNEYQPFPAPYHQRMYRDFIQAGADVVVGHHPHMPQGLERHGNGLIVYSLGNFLFDYEGHRSRKSTEVGMIALLSFGKAGVARVRLHPYRKTPTAGIEQLDPDAAARFFDYLDQTSAPLGDYSRLKSLWEQEVVELFETNYRSWLLKATAAFDRESPEEATARAFYNLFRCDAHHQGISSALRMMHEGRYTRDSALGSHIQKLIELLESCATS